MDFQLTEDQVAIADMAGSLFADLCTDERQRAFDTAGEPFMADVWAKCVETGLQALAIPEEVDGSGLGMTELMLVLDAQGQNLAQVPLWRHQIAAAALARFGGERGAALAREAASAERLLTLDLNGLASSRGVELRLSPAANGGFQLDGKVLAVALGEQAGTALLLAACDQGQRVVVVDLAAAGIAAISGVMMDGEALADLDFKGVAIAADAVLPAEALSWLEQRAIAALASLQLGVSDAQVRRTVEYINERRQFDRAIGSFQAVQMSMADAHIAIEALRSALYQLVYRLDAGLPSPSEALAVKYLANECGHIVGHKAQHVHGGIGVDLTYPIHRYLYWSRTIGITLGGSAATLERLGDWLANNDKLGWKYDLEEQQAL